MMIQKLVAVAAVIAGAVLSAPHNGWAQEYISGMKWNEPEVVTPGKTSADPPSDAIILFDGKDLSAWQNGDKWIVKDGVATIGKGDRFKGGRVPPQGVGSQPDVHDGNFGSILNVDEINSAIQGLVNDLAQAADAGTLDDPEVVLSRTPLELDERGWKKLNKLMAKTLDQALAIAAESSARRNEGSSDGVFPTEVGILHFRRANTAAYGS